MQSSQRRHILVCCPRCPQSHLRCSTGFQIARTLARNAHLKLGGDESRAGVVMFAESMCNEFIAERESYSISESLLDARRKHVKTYLRRFQPPPKTLYNLKLKELHENMYNKMGAEQRFNNGQLACFDDKTLAETWVACTVFIDALYRDIDYNDAEQMAMLACGSHTTLQASAVLLGYPHRVFP
eukprot:6214647-Pleurochrysis_carterae.AAC.2